MGLGGVSLWSLDMDDFRGAFCKLGKFPIIRAIAREFNHGKDSPAEEAEAVRSTTVSVEIESDVTNEMTAEIDDLGTTEPVDIFNLTPTNTTKRIQVSPTLTSGSSSTTTKKISVLVTTRAKATNKKAPPAVYSINNKRKFNNSLFDLNWSLWSALEKRLKSFKAVRDVQVTACLNKEFCSLNGAISAPFTKFCFGIFHSFILLPLQFYFIY